jgi:hypothetical protein
MGTSSMKMMLLAVISLAAPGMFHSFVTEASIKNGQYVNLAIALVQHFINPVTYPCLRQSLGSSFRRRPESSFQDFLDPGFRRGDGNKYVRLFMKCCT